MNILVGNTGLIGKTLSEKMPFDLHFNSKNIESFTETVPFGSTVYLSCLPATKWLVNKDLYNDLKNIHSIIDCLSKTSYKKIVLFSTIDVYCESPFGVDENFSPKIGSLSYGANRYLFELLVRDCLKTEQLQIFRLPALYNKHIKKNILFDLLNNNNVDQINTNSSFQWYNLDNIVEDINKYSELYPNKSLFNLFSEPVRTKDIVKLFPKYNISEKRDIVWYDYKTLYGGYIETKEKCLENIRKFVNEFSSN